MSIFESLGGQTTPMQQVNPMQMLQQIQSNPSAVLRSRGLTIPEGMSNPQQIVQHLVQSGQVSNSRLQQVMQMMGRR